MTSRVIDSPNSLQTLHKFLDSQKLPFTIEVVSGKHRTTHQNRLQRQWVNDIASQLPEQSAEEWRGYCKLHFGVAILKRDSELFAQEYDKLIKPLPYEAKMKLMQEPFDFGITRRMNTAQKTEYLNEIQRHFAEKGVELTDPEALKYQ